MFKNLCLELVFKYLLIATNNASIMMKTFITSMVLKLNIISIQDKSLKLFIDNDTESESKNKEVNTDTIQDSTLILFQFIKC